MKDIKWQVRDGKIYGTSLEEGATPQDIEAAMEEVEQFVPQSISTAGAPMRTRMAVGPESRKPEDRLATLRQYYPEAGFADRPGTDERKLVFPNPKTGRPTYYNPPGLDFGDIAEQSRLLSEAAGGLFGGTAAALSGVGAIGTPIAAGMGSEIAGSVYDFLLQTTTPRVETRSPLEQTQQGALNIATNIAGEKVADVLMPAMKAGAMRLMTGAPKETRAQGAALANLYRSQDIPTAGAPGAISGSPSVGAAQKTLEMMPTSARTMREASGKTFGAVQKRIDELSQVYGVPKPVSQMGQEISQSAGNMKKMFDARADKLTDDMAKTIGFDEIVPVSNLEALRDKFSSLYDESPATYSHLKGQIDELDAFIEEGIERGGMPARLINEKRKTIGQDLNERGTKGFMNKDQVTRRQMYGAAAADIEGAAAMAGPEAQKALKLQRKYIRGPKTALPGTKYSGEKQLEKLAQTSGRTAYDQMLKAARSGPDELRRMRKSMDMSTWNDFRSTALQDMGRATPGAQGAEGTDFSVNTFLTNWNKLPDQSRKLLFGDKKNLPASRDIEKLSQIMGSLKDVEKLRNFSNTGAYNMWYEILTGTAGLERMLQEDVTGAVAQTAGLLGVPYLTSKLMTSNAFVNFLTQPVKKGAGEFTKAMSRMIGRVVQEESDPQINEDLSRFVMGLNALKTSQQTAP